MVLLPTDARLMSPGQPSSLHWGQLDICQRTMTQCITEERGKVCGLQEVTVSAQPHTLCLHSAQKEDTPSSSDALWLSQRASPPTHCGRPAFP